MAQPTRQSHRLAVTPVVPILRSPGGDRRASVDHQVRVDGRPCCGARVNPDTWTVVPADRARNHCQTCEGATR